jgi:acyl-CoA-binding protein
MIILVETTAKPVLAGTFEQWPTANNGQSKPGQTKFNGNFDWKTSEELNGHYFGAPRVVVVDRFDCT